MWTYSFYHIVHGVDLKLRWQSDLGHIHIVQAVGLLTHLTEEVRVLILVVVMVVAVAEFVAGGVATTLDGMDEVLLVLMRGAASTKPMS